jgi:hypothetical protein
MTRDVAREFTFLAGARRRRREWRRGVAVLGRACDRGRPFMLVAALRAPIDGRVPRRIWVGTDALERKEDAVDLLLLDGAPVYPDLHPAPAVAAVADPALLRSVPLVCEQFEQFVVCLKLAEITHYPRDLRRCSACL